MAPVILAFAPPRHKVLAMNTARTPQLKTRLTKITIWLVAEITLNLLNMDTMADYGEFVFGQEFAIAHTLHPAITLCV